MGLSCYLTAICNLIVGFVIVKYVVSFVLGYLAEKKRNEKFKETPKDKVILHLFPDMKFPSNIPSCQPWVYKLELFFRLANIEYEFDYTCPVGPKGKSPWITINGKHQQDSHLILELLKKKFNVNLNQPYTEDQIAIARSVRVMLEERFFWCMPFWRFIWKEGREHFYSEFCTLKPLLPFYKPLSLFKYGWRSHYGQQAWGHGIGRFTKEEALALFKDDLRTVSKILGNKSFILGEYICEEDCAIFGMLTQPVYGMPGSPYDELIRDELPNLKAYCERIRIKYFADYKDWKY